MNFRLFFFTVCVSLASIAFAENDNIIFDLNFSDEQWLEDLTTALQPIKEAEGKPYDIRLENVDTGIDLGNQALPLNGFLYNGNVYKEAPFTSVEGGTYQYSFRYRNNQNTASFIEFPIVENAGKITLYVRNPNITDANTLDLGARTDDNNELDVNGGWKPAKPLHQWTVPGNGTPEYGTNYDYELTYDINEEGPIALRLFRKRGMFFNIYRVVLEKYETGETTSVASTLEDRVDMSVSNCIVYLSETLENAQTAVYDLTGTLVYEGAVNSDKIDLNGLKNGLYILKLSTEEGGLSRKIMLN